MTPRVVVIRKTLHPLLIPDLVALVLSYAESIPTSCCHSVSMVDMIESSRSWWDRIMNRYTRNEWISALSWCDDSLLLLSYQRLFLCRPLFTHVTLLYEWIMPMCGWKNRVYCIQRTEDSTSLLTLDSHGKIMASCMPLEDYGHDLLVNEDEIFVSKHSRVRVFNRHTRAILREFELSLGKHDKIMHHLFTGNYAVSFKLERIHYESYKGTAQVRIMDLSQDGKSRVLCMDFQTELTVAPTLQVCGNIVLAKYYRWNHLKVYALSDGSFIQEICHGQFSGVNAVLLHDSRLFVVDRDNKLFVFE